MPFLTTSSRREMEEHRFPPLALVFVPLLAIFFQAYLPLRFPRIGVLDLPVLVVIYFSVSRRGPIGGTLLGLTVGLVQDAATNLPLGVNGIIDCIVGYMAASIGGRIDVDNAGTRLIMNFTFMLLAALLHLLILRRLLGMHAQWFWVHELVRAVINALIGIILFALLDRLRRHE